MLKKSLFAIFAIALAVGITPAARAGDVLVVDIDTVYTTSLAGKSLLKQIRKKDEVIKKQVEAAQKELEKESNKLEGQKALLAPEALQAKTDELRLKSISKNQELQQEVRKVKAAQANANAQILKALSPILKDIMEEKKAAIVVERRTILIGSEDRDITDEAVKRLNAKLKSVKFEAPKN